MVQLEKSAIEDFRSRQLASLGSVDSMYGMVITTHILLHLAEFAALPQQPIRLRDNLFNRIMFEASERETKTYGRFVRCQQKHSILILIMIHYQPLSFHHTRCLLCI